MAKRNTQTTEVQAPVVTTEVHNPEMSATLAAQAQAEAPQAPETNPLQDKAKAEIETLQSAASKAAVRAFGNAERHSFEATVSLALSLCGEQMIALVTEQAHEPQKDQYVFRRDVLFPLARKGSMIYRDTAEQADAIAAMPEGKDRKAAAAGYVNTKGAKLVQGLSTLKTNSFRLAEYARLNMAATIVEAARVAQDASIEAATEFWRNAVLAQTKADSMAKLGSFLEAWNKLTKGEGKAKGKAEAEPQAPDASGEGEGGTAEPQAPQAPRNLVAEALAIVAGMSDAELAELAMRVAAEQEARAAQAPQAPQAEAPQAEPVKLAA